MGYVFRSGTDRGIKLLYGVLYSLSFVAHPIFSSRCSSRLGGMRGKDATLGTSTVEYGYLHQIQTYLNIKISWTDSILATYTKILVIFASDGLLH